jgi:branched-chain amino acid transport system substrate-binding protein
VHHATPPDHRRRKRSRRLATALVAVVLLVAAACGGDDDDAGGGNGSSDGSGDAPADEVLGTPNPASGDPVKVGFIADGRTPVLDNTHMVPAAEATVDYLNEYQGGIAGHPIELVTCETEGDPGKATNCGNQMVQEDVVLTIMPENQQPLAVHTVMAANAIPLFVYGVTDQAITQDAESSFMIASLTAGLSALPIDVAEEEGIDKVTVLVVDVPAATGFYEDGSFGAQQFDDAGIDLEVVKVPLGAPDITPQINEVVGGDDTVVQIVGDETLCIGAINGLKTNGFEGPITVLNTCVSEATKTAIGPNMEGVVMASPTPIGDDSNSGIQLWNAIYEKYAPDFDDATLGLTTFVTTYSAWQALEGLTGEVTPETVRTTIKDAAEMPLVTGAGLNFRCNGKAAPDTPAVCTGGALRVALDAEGNPVLPYTPFGEEHIPD